MQDEFGKIISIERTELFSVSVQMGNSILIKYWVVLICLGLAVVTFIAFEQVRNNDFTGYDDNTGLYKANKPYRDRIDE